MEIWQEEVSSQLDVHVCMYVLAMTYNVIYDFTKVQYLDYPDKRQK